VVDEDESETELTILLPGMVSLSVPTLTHEAHHGRPLNAQVGPSSRGATFPADSVRSVRSFFGQPKDE